MTQRGYFEIGVVNPKTPMNVGTLWRSAYQLGASGIFTVGHRYPAQSSDTYQTPRHVPLREFPDWATWCATRPYDAQLVAVEMGGRRLSQFVHPERAIYVLGAEDHGLPREVLDAAQHIVSIEAARVESYNVAVAGSIVMYHRFTNTERIRQPMANTRARIEAAA